MVQAPFHKMEIPTGKDVCRKRFFSFMDKLLQADISHGDYETYVPMLAEKFADISKEEVLKRVAAMEFDRFLKYYENAEDLNIRGSAPRSTRKETFVLMTVAPVVTRPRCRPPETEGNTAAVAIVVVEETIQGFCKPWNKRWFYKQVFPVHSRYERPEKRSAGAHRHERDEQLDRNRKWRKNK